MSESESQVSSNENESADSVSNPTHTIERTNREVFDETVKFSDLGLHPDILQGITDKGFEKPTDIQGGLIPLVMQGKDVMGQARTGTGKTASFGLPVLSLIKEDPDHPMQALILAPTRELAVQVAAELDELGKHTGIRTVSIIGGSSMKSQTQGVKKGAQIIVGTPGRVMDLYSRKEIHFKHLRFVVLDEVDRMLDIGFRDDIRKILGTVERDTKNRRKHHQGADEVKNKDADDNDGGQDGGQDNQYQTIFVSATISEEIERIARRFMRPDAEKLVTVSGSLTVSRVEQQYLSVQPWDKRALLLHLLRHEDPDTTIVFCKTKQTVRKVTAYIKSKGIEAKEIHGDLAQGKRNRTLKSLRGGTLDVLVASDLAARGLDVDHITHVINYDLPEDPDVYIHRIGRTARAGRKGHAWSFVSPDQGQLLTEIEKLAGIMIERMDYPDFKPGPVPDRVKEEQEREKQKEANLKKSRTLGTDTSALSDEEKAAMFPGGKVPTGGPKRGLGSRFRRRGR